MRVFVFEYTAGGGLAEHPNCQSLRAEGTAMLFALLDDLARLPDIQTRTLLDRPPPPGADQRWQYRLVESAQEKKLFESETRAADATLVIAPESDGILAAYSRRVEDSGGFLLGPSSEAVRLAGDKLVLAQRWRDRGIPTPDCWPISSRRACPLPAVLKPRDGAGSQATFLARTREELDRCVTHARAEGWTGEMLAQPFVSGLAASVALLIGPRQVMTLPPAAQHLSQEGRFHYRGGELPLRPDLAVRAVRLAERAVSAVPGLRGYVGVDLVLGEVGEWAIEINPRLTTSYLGLRALADTNLAEAMLRVTRGEECPEPKWRAGSVRFDASGRRETASE